ncbi:MAG: hypothetical protein H0T17_06295 [Propionibacteriales bacterium]|nr:hypothetical protein [Propionibacteriales bacterium]
MSTRQGGSPMRTRSGTRGRRPGWLAPESLVWFLAVVIALIAASVSGLLIGAGS